MPLFRSPLISCFIASQLAFDVYRESEFSKISGGSYISSWIARFIFSLYSFLVLSLYNLQYLSLVVLELYKRV